MWEKAGKAPGGLGVYLGECRTWDKAPGALGADLDEGSASEKGAEADDALGVDLGDMRVWDKAGKAEYALDSASSQCTAWEQAGDAGESGCDSASRG